MNFQRLADARVISKISLNILDVCKIEPESMIVRRDVHGTVLELQKVRDTCRKPTYFAEKSITLSKFGGN